MFENKFTDDGIFHNIRTEESGIHCAERGGKNGHHGRKKAGNERRFRNPEKEAEEDIGTVQNRKAEDQVKHLK